MQKRILLFPVAWVAFGVGQVLILQYLLGGVTVPTIGNDKPIGGSLLPFLFSSTALVLIAIGVSLYSIGYWQPDFSAKKGRVELSILAVLVVSGFLVFYTPFAVFPLVLAGFYFLATNLD